MTPFGPRATMLEPRARPCSWPNWQMDEVVDVACPCLASELEAGSTPPTGQPEEGSGQGHGAAHRRARRHGTEEWTSRCEAQFLPWHRTRF